MVERRRASIVWQLAALVAVPIVLVACNSTAQRRAELQSSPPLERAQAAVALAEAGDADAVDLLVNNLEHRDAAVRLYAILALERLTGETYGFEYYDPPAERSAAVSRWRAARAAGAVSLRATAVAPADTPIRGSR